VHLLVNRYRSAGLDSIAHDFYSGGPDEMLRETNRRVAITNSARLSVSRGKSGVMKKVLDSLKCPVLEV
jgi:hypothetical protein